MRKKNYLVCLVHNIIRYLKPGFWKYHIQRHLQSFVKIWQKLKKNLIQFALSKKTRGYFSSSQISCNNSEAQYDDGLTTFKKS